MLLFRIVFLSMLCCVVHSNLAANQSGDGTILKDATSASAKEVVKSKDTTTAATPHDSLIFTDENTGDRIASIIDSLRRNPGCSSCREMLQKGLVFLFQKGLTERVFTLTDSADAQGWGYRNLHRLRGEMLVETDDLPHAEEELTSALRMTDSAAGMSGKYLVNADNPCLYYSRALARTMTGQFALALDDIDKAIKQDALFDDGQCEVSSGARAVRAQVLYNLTNPGWSLSKTVLDDIAADQAGMETVLGKHYVTYVKGACLDMLERNREATDVLRPLLDVKADELGSLHPILVNITYYQAWIDQLIDEGKIDSAKIIAKRAQDSLPSVPFVQTTQFDLYWMQGKFDKALEYKGVVDDQFPQSTSLTCTLQARTLAQLNRCAEARTLIDKALTYDTTSIRARIANAEVYTVEKNFDKAAEALAYARMLDTLDPRVDMGEALLHAAQNKQDKALECIIKAYRKGFRDEDRMVTNFKLFSNLKKSRAYKSFIAKNSTASVK